MKIKSNFDDDRRDFESYLINTFDFSKKAAKDCASRCKRIEIHVSKNLSTSVSSIDSYENLLIQIQHYAVSVYAEKKKAYALAGTLRGAAKKYALYLYPDKANDYPKAYGTTRYS